MTEKRTPSKDKRMLTDDEIKKYLKDQSRNVRALIRTL